MRHDVAATGVDDAIVVVQDPAALTETVTVQLMGEDVHSVKLTLAPVVELEDVPVDAGPEMADFLHVRRMFVPTENDAPVEPDALLGLVLSVEIVTVHVARPVVHVKDAEAVDGAIANAATRASTPRSPKSRVVFIRSHFLKTCRCSASLVHACSW